MKNKGGVGSIFPKKGTKNLQWKFYRYGKMETGSTGTPDGKKAARVLQKKIELAGMGKLPTAVTRRTTLKDLANLVFSETCTTPPSGNATPTTICSRSLEPSA
jgi:hypothetical protein